MPIILTFKALMLRLLRPILTPFLKLIPLPLRDSLRTLYSFFQFIALRFRAARCTQVASSLTFTTLLALVPLFTIGLSVYSQFPAFGKVSNRFRNLLMNNLVPDSAGRILTVYTKQFADNAAQLTILGGILLALTALLTLFTIERAFNDIWQTAGLKKTQLLKRVIVYWSLLTLGPLLLGLGFSLSSRLFSYTHGKMLGILFVEALPVVLAFMAFSLLYILIPRCHVPTKQALLCGGLAACFFYISQNLFSWYLDHFNTYKLVYGAFASLPIFLLWLYLIWFIVLAGAVLCAALPYWHKQSWRWHQLPGRQLFDALRCLFALHQAFLEGKPKPITELNQTLCIGYDQLQQLLIQLANAQLIVQNKDDKWSMIKPLSCIYLDELYHLFVFSLPSLRQLTQNINAINAFEIILLQKMEQLEISLHFPISELIVIEEQTTIARISPVIKH